MPSPLIRHRSTAIFAPQYCGSVAYYATLASYSHAVIDLDMRYDKRFKSTHRCDIADTRGKLSLTVPIDKVTTRCSWSQVTVSDHGQWWSDHIVSLESAYGRTPFFEFYIDRLKPWLANHHLTVGEMDKGLDMEIRRILALDTKVTYALSDCQGGGDASSQRFIDFRSNLFGDIATVPYYQVRQDKLGFIPGLSILDLIFNLGTEAPLVLRDMADQHKANQ